MISAIILAGGKGKRMRLLKVMIMALTFQYMPVLNIIQGR